MLHKHDVENREKVLRMAIERTLPDFVKPCQDDVEKSITHQDGFAADYDEYELLGMAIKHAGLYGKEVRIIGRNRETLTASAAN